MHGTASAGEANEVQEEFKAGKGKDVAQSSIELPLDMDVMEVEVESGEDVAT